MIRLVCIGKNKDKALQALEKEYCKRVSLFDKVEVLEVKDEPNPPEDRTKEMEKVKETEGERVLAKIRPGDFVVLLDLHGKMPDSLQFASQLDAWRQRGSLVFVIAGSLGPSSALRARADVRLKLSDLTFTHLMTRVLLLEQIYRGFMINNHRNYHK